MGLNIKNQHVEALAQEVAKLTGESKTQAIGRALEERRARLAIGGMRGDRTTDLRRFLEREIWPRVPRSARGRRLTRTEEARILGLGRRGV